MPYEGVLRRVQSDPLETHNLVQMITQLSAYRHMTLSYIALDRPLDAIASATAAVAVAQELGSDARVADALRHRVVAHLAAGNLAEAEVDISRALSGLDETSKSRYLPDERARLEALLQGRLAGDSPGP